MSFARWGPQSDVYVFIYGDYEYVTCFGCLLAGYEEDGEGYPTYFNFNTRNLSEMMQHMNAHRDAEHKVPEDIYETMKERWPFTE